MLFLCYTGRMQNDAIHDFIEARKHLVWYVRDYRAVNEDAIVEATLNYGNWNDVQELLRILGIPRVAHIFRTHMATARKRGNYYPDVRHYFGLYFGRYADMA